MILWAINTYPRKSDVFAESLSQWQYSRCFQIFFTNGFTKKYIRNNFAKKNYWEPYYYKITLEKVYYKKLLGKG